MNLNISDNYNKDMLEQNNEKHPNIINTELDLKATVSRRKLKQNFPFSFVLNRGLNCKNTLNLTKDVRRMLDPYTSAKLGELYKNGTIEDIVNASKAYDSSRLFIFDKCESEVALKIAKLPSGPTLSFKVEDFTSAFVMAASHNVSNDAYKGVFCTTALVILNNCTEYNKDKDNDKHMRLVVSTFKNMFPIFGRSTVSTT